MIHKYFETFFSLGGLAGIPFAGKTGFGAFAHHVPDGGNIFVLYAPHCAVSNKGGCGFYSREGQTEESTACGARIGGYNAVKNQKEEPKLDMLSCDMQMGYIKNVLWKKNRQQIANAPNANPALTYVLYEHI